VYTLYVSPRCIHVLRHFSPHCTHLHNHVVGEQRRHELQALPDSLERRDGCIVELLGTERGNDDWRGWRGHQHPVVWAVQPGRYNWNIMCRILGPRSGGYEEYCLLGYNAV
jgi:hypothetical protein